MNLIKIFVICLSIISFNLFATEAKPGLWEVKMKFSHDGKEMDPMATLMKEIEKMPEESKKMILEQMKKNSNTNQGFSKVCYTKDMLSDPSKIAEKENQDCKFVEKSKTAKKVTATFKCKDGSTGTSVWELKNSKSMQMKIEFVDSNGKSGKMDYRATFLQDKCI